MSNREFMINTSSQIIARRVKAEPTQAHREQKMGHKWDHHTRNAYLLYCFTFSKQFSVTETVILNTECPEIYSVCLRMF